MHTKKTFLEPYQLVSLVTKKSARCRIVQIISRPIPQNPNGDFSASFIDDTIMVRMVPGDPTTMQEIRIVNLFPITRKRRWVHIARVHSRFIFPEDMLRYDNAALFDHTINEDKYYAPREGALIYQIGDKKTSQWTMQRWLSFSARICDVTTIDLSKCDIS